MTNLDVQRVQSPHLEDLAYVVLSAQRDGTGFSLYPDLTDEMRTRLRSRIKQLSRYDWPSSLRDDPALRRGMTLRQCLRLTVTLLLIDAHLPPSLAVMIARNNELGFLRAAGAALDPSTDRDVSASDRVAVILASEIQEALAFPGRADVQEERVRFISRSELKQAWSGDLAASGARLVIDITAAVTALWRWISERRLMSDIARSDFLTEVETVDDANFVWVADRQLRR